MEVTLKNVLISIGVVVLIALIITLVVVGLDSGSKPSESLTLQEMKKFVQVRSVESFDTITDETVIDEKNVIMLAEQKMKFDKNMIEINLEYFDKAFTLMLKNISCDKNLGSKEQKLVKILNYINIKKYSDLNSSFFIAIDIPIIYLVKNLKREDFLDFLTAYFLALVREGVFPTPTIRISASSLTNEEIQNLGKKDENGNYLFKLEKTADDENIYFKDIFIKNCLIFESNKLVDKLNGGTLAVIMSGEQRITEDQLKEKKNHEKLQNKSKFSADEIKELFNIFLYDKMKQQLESILPELDTKFFDDMLKTICS